MRAVAILTLVAALAAWVVVRHLPESTAVADATPSSYTPQSVRSVSLDGRGLPLAALRDVLETKVGTTLDRDRLAHDRDALEHLLQTRGYLRAKVSPAVVTFAGNSVYVVFPIERGPEFHVRDVKLVGVNDRDGGIVTIGAWDTANPDRIERVRQALEAAGKGRVAAALATDATASAVDVTFTVTP